MASAVSARENAFSDFSDPNACYWYGFLYADGNVASSSDRIALALAEKDRDQVERFREFIGTNAKVLDKHQMYQGQDYICAQLRFANKPLATRLRQLGILAHRPRPELPMTFIPRLNFRHFARGLFDGDGCASGSKFLQIQFMSYEPILLYIRDQLTSIALCDVRPNLQTHPGGKIKRLTYGHYQDLYMIYSYLYTNAKTFMPRKKKVILDYLTTHAPQKIMKARETAYV
jgi:hypothetical protein